MDQDDDLKVLKCTATELNDIKDLIAERLTTIYEYISKVKDSRKSPTSLPEQLLQDDDEPINEDITEVTTKLNDFCKSCKNKFTSVETNIETLIKKRNKRKNSNKVITNGSNINSTPKKTITNKADVVNVEEIIKETNVTVNDSEEIKEDDDDACDSDGSNKRPIRMVPIEKLMRPNLVNEPVRSTVKTRALSQQAALANKTKDTAIPTICINSDSDDSDTSSVQSASKLKNIKVTVKKLPHNLLSFMKTHGLKEIRNHNNEIITKLDETPNEAIKLNDNTNSNLNVSNNKKKVRFSLKLDKSDDDSKSSKIKNKNKKMNKQDEKLINLYKNKDKKSVKDKKDDTDVDDIDEDDTDEDEDDSESTNVKTNNEKAFNIELLNKNYKEKKTLNKENDENEKDTKSSSGSSSSSSSSNSSSSSSNSSSSDSDSDSENTNAKTNKKRMHETDNNESDSDSDTVPLKQINDPLNKNKKIKLTKDIDANNIKTTENDEENNLETNNHNTNVIDNNIYLNNIINDTEMVINNVINDEENDSNGIINSSIYENIQQEIEINAEEETMDDSSNENEETKNNEESDDAEFDENNSASEEPEQDVNDKDYKNDEEDEDSSENNTKKKGGKSNLSDSDDSDVFQPKGNRKKKPKANDSKSVEESDNTDLNSPEKPKRLRRIKLLKNESSSDDENESHNKGRKNIRKLLKDRDLDSGTKQAAREEYERKRRIEERQKLYNQVYDEEPEKVKVLDRLVLDFDDETKEELLTVDKGIVTKLKPHQANGIKFMFDACFESIKQLKTDIGSGCILAHCMGLGKTLQVVSLCHTLISNSDKTKVNRALVICPLSTSLNWVNEFQMWQKSLSFQVDVYEISKYKKNNERANKLEEWYNDGGVMVLGYDIFRNLANESNARLRKKMKQQLKTSLIDPGPDLVICDEGHLLKNEKTSLSKAVNRIRTRRRIVLTGTPLQNNLKEYYCMVQFVKPNLLGTYNEYMNRFVNPITNGQYTDSTQRDIQIMKRRSHVLHKLLNGCVQRRDYNVLAPFLPPKHEYVVFIRLTELQCGLYKFYMENKAKRLDSTQKRTSFLFTDFQNLQRIWTHPRVLRYSSDKFEQKQKKLELEESDSEGSLKDFIEENSETSSPSEESADEKDNSDDSTDNKKKVINTRKTRSRVKDEDFQEEEVIPEKKENPTEWWMAMCDDSELDNMENSGKLILLFSILEQCVEIGDKLLVFSQSLYSLDVIEHFLSLVDDNTQNPNPSAKLGTYKGSWSPGLDYFRLDGSTSVENRALACKAFNRDDNPRARLFLISTRAGGLGINLTAANRVIIFDASWNPSHDVQSIFRVYRFGQKKPCYIYRFLAMGTMEEKIYERQVTKQAISKRVIDEQQIDRHYKENDLMELYNFDIEPVEPRPIPLLPKDRLFAELLKQNEIIYKFHEHDSLLENKEEETLNEEERKAAWEEFEDEKKRPLYTAPAVTFGTGRVNGPMTSSSIYGIRSDIMLRLLSLKARLDNPILTENEVRQVIPLLLKELQDQMSNGEVTLFQTLISLQKELEVPPMLPTPYQQTQQQNQVINPYAAALAQMNPMFGMGNLNMNQLMNMNMNMTQYKMAAAAVAAAGYSGASTGSPTADKYLLQHQQKLQQQVLQQQQQLIEQTQNKYIKKNTPAPQMSKEIIELD